MTEKQTDLNRTGPCNHPSFKSTVCLFTSGKKIVFLDLYHHLIKYSKYYNFEFGFLS